MTGSTAGGAGRPVLPVGDRALLVQCRGTDDALALSTLLHREPLPGQAEVVPAAETVLVRSRDRAALPGLAALLADLDPPPAPRRQGQEVTVETVYDGEDLQEVARLTGLSTEGVVRAHTGTPWTAAFVGFAPGFAYLVGGDPRLAVRRRSEPRTQVPAGSVALGGPYSAVYPRASPGGWQLVGRTGAVLWDPHRTHPALLTAGTTVVFRAVRDVVRLRGACPAAPAQVPAPSTTPAAAGRSLTVVSVGAQALVEDLGRPGHLDVGVSPGGAVDRGAAVRANRLVGNARGSAVVEAVLGGLALLAAGEHVLAVTGAPAGLEVTAPDGRTVARPPVGSPFMLGDGHTLTVTEPDRGLRSYVAVRGGIGGVPVLGSRSTDVLSGLGRPPLAAGDVLPVLPPPGDAVPAEPDRVEPPRGPVHRLEVVPGPRDDWLTAEGRRRLHGQEWTVADGSRIGLRLSGRPLERGRHDELASEGTVVGAVQVPPSGLPIVLLPDHPVTGGYPVVAVVRTADLDRLGQVRPGERLVLVLEPVPVPVPGGR